ncbi:MAG: SulP family inorganic anion transporter, partial [Rhodomicrobium sp.]
MALGLTLAFLAGVVELGMGVLRLGALVNFISHSVIAGFTAGAGVSIRRSGSAPCPGIVVRG